LYHYIENNTVNSQKVNLPVQKVHYILNLRSQILKEKIMKKLIGLLIMSLFMASTSSLVAQTVYVNKTDSKYHLLTCKYLDPSHDSLDMTFALKKGLGACSVCKPNAKGTSSSGSMDMDAPNSMSSPKSMDKSGMKKEGDSAANLSKQCAVIEKDGKRCIGQIEPGSIYCWEHRNYKK